MPTRLFNRFASLFTFVVVEFVEAPLVRPANDEELDEAEMSEAGLDRAVGDDVDEEDEDVVVAPPEYMGDMMGGWMGRPIFVFFYFVLPDLLSAFSFSISTLT